MGVAISKWEFTGRKHLDLHALVQLRRARRLWDTRQIAIETTYMVIGAITLNPILAAVSRAARTLKAQDELRMRLCLDLDNIFEELVGRGT